MTTKPTRKAPAAAKPATPSSSAAPAAPDPKRAISEIETLVLRHKFLEADQSYRAAIATTNEEEDRLLAMHDVELRKIEGKLATLIPDNIYDISSLLEFVTDWAEGCMVEGDVLDMLNNVQISFWPVWSDEVQAAVAKAKKKESDQARDFIHRAFEFSDKRTEEALAGATSS